MKIIFLEPAKKEFFEAIKYYQDQKKGLGYEFAFEVETGLQKILEFPDAWQKISKRIRRYILRRFPYAILYEMQQSKLIVAAIMNLHKNPENYEKRIS